MATAIFGDPTKSNIVPIDWAQRWPSLQSGDIDIVIKKDGLWFHEGTPIGREALVRLFSPSCARTPTVSTW